MSDRRILPFSGAPDHLHDEVARLLAHYQNAKRTPVSMTSRHWRPLVDVFETEKGVYVMADLAGMTETAVHIVVEGSCLLLRGDRRLSGPPERRQYLQMEIPAGPFERRIDLPSYADLNRAEASYDNGFLEVFIPRRSREPSRNVRIRVRGQ